MLTDQSGGADGSGLMRTVLLCRARVAAPVPVSVEREKENTVAKMIYSGLASLDGYIADEQGNFDWAVPDEEVLVFLNDLERSVGTYLYGRRMYELMVGWETDPAAAA